MVAEVDLLVGRPDGALCSGCCIVICTVTIQLRVSRFPVTRKYAYCSMYFCLFSLLPCIYVLNIPWRSLELGKYTLPTVPAHTRHSNNLETQSSIHLNHLRTRISMQLHPTYYQWPSLSLLRVVSLQIFAKPETLSENLYCNQIKYQ